MSLRGYLIIFFFLLTMTCVTGNNVFFTEPGKVYCNGWEMQPGDTCKHTSKGKTTEIADYETQKRYQEIGKYLSTIGFFPLALGTIGWLCFGVFAAAKRVKRRPSSLSARAKEVSELRIKSDD